MISEEYIMGLLKQFAASPEGKAEIKKQYRKEYDGGGGQAVERIMVAREAKQILHTFIKKHIPSIKLEDLVLSNPVMDEKGRTVLKISFRSGALRRESLDPDRYPEGIEDIVLHFTHGWNAKARIGGIWKHPDGKRGRKVWSRQTRKPGDFLKRAVNEFNRKHYCGYAYAELDEKYT